MHCAGEAAEYLQEGNHYVALSQKKLEEIWQKRTCGSGGGQSRAGTAGMSPSPVEEFMKFLHFGAWLTWQSGQPPRLLLCKIRRPSLSRYSQTKVLSFPYLPQQNWCLHLALPRVMQLRLHLPFNRDGARAMVELGETVRDSFLTFNNIMCTQYKILDKLNQNEERLSRRNISDERGERRRISWSRVPSPEVA